jgi:hypothetical protein
LFLRFADYLLPLRNGVLPVNPGPPDSPPAADVRKYPGKFLMDGCVPQKIDGWFLDPQPSRGK